MVKARLALPTMRTIWRRGFWGICRRSLRRDAAGGADEGLAVEADGRPLFRAEDLARARGSRPAKFERVVVAVDLPASAHGDAWWDRGGGRKDRTGWRAGGSLDAGLSPAGWARGAQPRRRGNLRPICAGGGQSGREMVRSPLGQATVRAGEAGPRQPVEEGAGGALLRFVRAGAGGSLRAFPALEEEMMALGARRWGQQSPDRADALVQR